MLGVQYRVLHSPISLRWNKANMALWVRQVLSADNISIHRLYTKRNFSVASSSVEAVTPTRNMAVLGAIASHPPQVRRTRSGRISAAFSVVAFIFLGSV